MNDPKIIRREVDVAADTITLTVRMSLDDYTESRNGDPYASIHIQSMFMQELQAGDVERADALDPKPGDHFQVKVGAKYYDTVIDEQGTQRFVRNGPVNALIDHALDMFDEYWMKQRVANHPAVYSLNEIVRDFRAGKWTLEEQIDFYTMFGYSIDGFASLSFVEDVEIINPLWE